MNKKLYFKNLLPFLLLQFVCMAALTVFLLINRLSPSAVAFILLIWCLVLSAGIFFSYLHRKHQLEALLRFTENLKERYLISEMMPVPERADDLIFYKILRLSNKSMLEQISQVHQERAEYREYIEQWVHEVKTPLAAMKLLCENEHSPASRRMLSEIEKTGHFIEQALYYTRMEHLCGKFLCLASFIRRLPITNICCGKTMPQFRSTARTPLSFATKNGCALS
mgnify:CR=1 FL=1